MSATTSAPVVTAATGRLSSRRLAGIGGLAFGVILIVQNGALLSGAPMADAATAEAAGFFDEHATKAAVASGLVAINLLFMLLLAAATRDISRVSGGRRVWADLGASAATALVAVFGATAVAQVAMILLADGGASPAFEAVWTLHNAALAFAMPVTGATFLGLSLGLHDAGAVRPWLRYLGMVGGALMIVAGLFNVAVADGSPIAFLGFPGFGLWIVWLLVAGTELVRQP